MKGTSSVFWSLICVVVLRLCILSQAPAPSETPEQPKNELDLIHFGDLIDVDFAGTLEYDWRGTLTSTGTLEGLDQLSTITGLCRSENDIADELARIYSKILRDPKVTVRIVDRSNRAVARLDGAIKIPMRFRVMRTVRLRELIVAAGGLTDDASGEITILRRPELNCLSQLGAASSENRPSGNGLQAINISISELLTGKTSADPLVFSGDIITVDKAFPIYVIGAVNNPRPIYSRSGMTLTRAISTAGDLAKGAIVQKVTIFRRDNSETNIVQVDLEKIKKGEINDVDLKPFDIIEVAFKGRVQRKYPPVIAASENKIVDNQDLPLRIID
ncbi:MAG: SLBB domain-containing protein [Chloracidobacterium sp.]|nr:SLBB domain-containing protein [Chloracidobacterium sp.]